MCDRVAEQSREITGERRLKERCKECINTNAKTVKTKTTIDLVISEFNSTKANQHIMKHQF
jgi:hypothetical protein